MRAQRRQPVTPDIWPGFVDALATLLMVLIFLLLMFILSQLVLNDTLFKRNRTLADLHARLSSITEQLNLAEQTKQDLRTRLQSTLGELEATKLSLQQKDDTLSKQTQQIIQLQESVAALESLKQSLQAELLESQTLLQKQDELTQQERQKLLSAQAEIALMNNNLQALRTQLAQLSALLEDYRARDKAQNIEIAELGKKLNTALASKAQQLARYRSEFFGRLRKILQNRSDVQIVGDRFVFQSEVLFAVGSDEIGERGKEQLRPVAEALRDLRGKIPGDIDWVLRVDGHTDSRAIKTARFPSNWELSSARAISVIRFFISQGVPAQRLVAAGFGEFNPRDRRDDEIAYRRNRRIELKLTQR